MYDGRFTAMTNLELNPSNNQISKLSDAEKSELLHEVSNTIIANVTADAAAKNKKVKSTSGTDVAFAAVSSTISTVVTSISGTAVTSTNSDAVASTSNAAAVVAA